MENKVKAKYMISQVTPKLLEFFLKNIRKNKIFRRDDLVKRRKQQGSLGERDPVLISELIKTLGSFGLLSINKDKSFTLTDSGNDIKNILLKKKDLFYELYHVINYFSFAASNGDYKLLPFESYRYLTEIIYHSRNNINKKQLANEIDTKIQNNYNVIGSFSEVCSTRGIAWLRCLSPSIFNENDTVEYRTPQYLEPIILLINYIYKIRGIEIGDPVFLDKTLKEMISIPLFVDVLIVEELLKNIASEYYDLLEFKFNISGPYIKLKKNIKIGFFK